MAGLTSVGFSSNGEVDLESLRARLRKLSDWELKRAIRAAENLCRDANFGKPSRQTFVMQLREAIAERDRRKAQQT